MNYVVGSTVTARSRWTDSDGVAVDPTVVLTIRDPDDNVTTPVVANPTTGTFTAPVPLDVVGIYYGEWEGTTAEGTMICQFTVCVVESTVLVSS